MQQQIEQARVAKQQREVEETRLKKTRIKTKRLKKKRLKVFVCKRCFVKFFNNIKLHEHIRNHHAKKFKVALFTFSISFTLLALFIIFVAFNMSSQIFSKFLLTLSFTSLVLFATSFSTSKKIYLTMNNFFVMFIEKSKSLDLQHRSKNSFFSSR